MTIAQRPDGVGLPCPVSNALRGNVGIAVHGEVGEG